MAGAICFAGSADDARCQRTSQSDHYQEQQMSGMYNNDVLLAGSFGLRLVIRAWLVFQVSSAALSDVCDLNMLLAL